MRSIHYRGDISRSRRSFTLGAALACAGVGARAGISAGVQEGVTKSEILLGHTGVLSGALSAPVKSMLTGANVAFEEINSHGGIYGRKLRLITLDDQLKPEKAVANYNELLSDQRVFGFFGCVGSGTTSAAADILKQSGAPLVGGYSVADSAREKVRGSAYFVRATLGSEAQRLVDHLLTIGINRIAVAHLDNAGGLEALSLIDAVLAARKLKPALAVGVAGDGSNIAAAAKAIAAAQPQAVIMYAGGTVAPEIMRGVWANGSRPRFCGMTIVPGELTHKILGAEAQGLIIAQVMPYPWGEFEPMVRNFRKLAAQASIPVDYKTFEGYVSAGVLIEALKRAGQNLSRPGVHEALRTMKFRIAGMDINFNGGNHTGSRFVELVQVKADGRFAR